MRISKPKAVFQPITIVLETAKEVQSLNRALYLASLEEQVNFVTNLHTQIITVDQGL